MENAIHETHKTWVCQRLALRKEFYQFFFFLLLMQSKKTKKTKSNTELHRLKYAIPFVQKTIP